MIEENYKTIPSGVDDVLVYIVNYKDTERRARMVERFEKVGMKINFIDPVENTDVRIKDLDVGIEKRTSCVMLQHMDSIKNFYNQSDCEYCIVGEDDVLISKHFKTVLPEVLSNFKKLNLDLLLLGYMFSQKIYNVHFPLKNGSYSYNEFPNDLWGSQMYLISRKHAKFLLDKYTIQFAIDHKGEAAHPDKMFFSPDWSLTKEGNRAVIIPMIALEEGNVKNDNWSQNKFHKESFEVNYSADVYF
jgi:GR25 family glycosyltransferase involved in LPS biosynthesis